MNRVADPVASLEGDGPESGSIGGCHLFEIDDQVVGSCRWRIGDDRWQHSLFQLESSCPQGLERGFERPERCIAGLEPRQGARLPQHEAVSQQQDHGQDRERYQRFEKGESAPMSPGSMQAHDLLASRCVDLAVDHSGECRDRRQDMTDSGDRQAVAGQPPPRLEGQVGRQLEAFRETQQPQNLGG